MSDHGTNLAQQTNKIGAVTVVGGGIAGIQCALDIANSGFKVYLVEEQPNVGGVMAQLDKTFPTNDCSSCMMGPKLVELANHRNIEIMTRTSVEGIEGQARQLHPDRQAPPALCHGRSLHRLRRMFQGLSHQMFRPISIWA